MKIAGIIWLEDIVEKLDRLGDYWDQTEPVDFEIDIQSETTYYAVESTLAMKLHKIARQRGISAETLLNLWVQEKIDEPVVVN